MRQSGQGIDHAIVDVAAALFAQHGYRHTSVQLVADAVGYSKPGLLHRFGSKDALHHAALAEAAGTAEELTGLARTLAGHPDRVTRVLELATRRALARPGTASLLLCGLGDPGPPDPADDHGLARPLLDELDGTDARTADRLRLVLALRLVVSAAVTQRMASPLGVPAEELVPLVVGLATGVAGAHAGDPRPGPQD